MTETIAITAVVWLAATGTTLQALAIVWGYKALKGRTDWPSVAGCTVLYAMGSFALLGAFYALLERFA
jgi:hypothetical protein